MLSKILLILLSVVCVSGCVKEDFLNVKPRKDIIVPTKAAHLQALLDDDETMNGASVLGVTPQLGESGSDNIFLRTQDFNIMRPQMQNYYIWANEPYAGVSVSDWEYPYKAIMYANTVLQKSEELSRNEADNRAIYKDLRGQALFHRAFMYFNLAQVFAPAYDPKGTNAEPGIILRKSADINEPLSRASVADTYRQIIDDAKEAIGLLSIQTVHKGRPSKQAGYGLLARTYLSMGKYDLAGIYADSCLMIQNTLLDFNSVELSGSEPFMGRDNPVYSEVIFYSAMQSSLSQDFPTSFNYCNVDSVLYKSYDMNDLRKIGFFNKKANGDVRFKGSYSYRGSPHYFSGLATDEIILTRAECSAWTGNLKHALDDLNSLLEKRWKKGTFKPLKSEDQKEVLNTILEERRKELLFRGLRWSDLKRLNIEGYDISLQRHVDGNIYKLEPGDSRWVWPFPNEVQMR